MPAPSTASAPILVNGQARDLPPDVVLPDLLRRVGLDPEQPGVAVARNGAVVRRSAWSETTVRAGDEIEIITATQGG